MYTGSRIHGCLGQKKIRFFSQPSQCAQVHGFTASWMSLAEKIRVLSNIANVHRFTDSRMSWAEKNKSFFSNLANVHGFTDSRIHGCLHLSSAASHQHQFTPFTDSRVHGCLGQKKNKSYFFQHSQCSRIHGFTDVTDVFTCHQHLHINTSSRIHGFTDVLGRKK